MFVKDLRAGCVSEAAEGSSLSLDPVSTSPAPPGPLTDRFTTTCPSNRDSPVSGRAWKHLVPVPSRHLMLTFKILTIIFWDGQYLDQNTRIDILHRRIHFTLKQNGLHH